MANFFSNLLPKKTEIKVINKPREDELASVLSRVANRESGGQKNPYATRTSTGRKAGEYALGKYQIVNTYLQDYARRAGIKRKVTEQEFLNSPELQEQITSANFKLDIAAHGAEGAVAKWFTGSPNPNPNVKDRFGTTAKAYVDSILGPGKGKFSVAPKPQSKTLSMPQDNFFAPIANQSQQFQPEQKGTFKAPPIGDLFKKVPGNNFFSGLFNKVDSFLETGSNKLITRTQDRMKQIRLSREVSEKERRGEPLTAEDFAVRRKEAESIWNLSGTLGPRDLGDGIKALKGTVSKVADLVQEAKKFKSADEFVDHYIKNTNKIQKTPEYQKFLREKDAFVKKEEEIFSEMKVMRDKYAGKSIEDVPRKEVARYEKLQKEVSEIMHKKTIAPIPEDAIRTVDHIGEKGFTNQLTDIWNDANGVKTGLLKELPPSQGPGSGKTPPPAGSPKTPKDVSDDVSYFYNVNRLNIPQRARQSIVDEIVNVKDEIKDVVGTRLSNKEVLDLAATTEKVLSKTVTREQTAAKIASNLKLRQAIAEKAESGEIDEEFIKLFLADKAAGEDIARQLQARVINADPIANKAISVILDSIYKVNKNADEVIAASKGVDWKDPEKVAEFYRKFVKPNFSEWLDKLRYNSMLSSPTTHIVNTSSNLQGSAIITPVEKAITGGLDALKSAITGKERTAYAGESVAYAKGYIKNVATASKKFIGVLTGKVANANPDVRDIPLTKAGTKARVAENVLSFPMRALEAMDQFFTTLVEGGVKGSLAFRMTKKGEVPTPGVLDMKASQEAAYRIFRESGSKNQGMVLDALDGVTNLMMEARASKNPLLSLVSRFTLPFVRTPINLFKQGIEFSPLGVTTMVGSTRKTEQLSKIIIGSSSALGAAMLLGDNRLTWAEPTNATRKSEFRAAGLQPYSIKIGNKWYSYSKLHPALAFNFALVASIDDSMKNAKLNESDADSILNAFAKYGNFLVDQSYAKNIGDFLAAVKGDSDRWTSYFSNYPQQLIPLRALMGWVTRLVDPLQRQADPDGSILERQMQQIMTQIPGLSSKVPARLAPDGTPIKNQHQVLNAFSPIRVTTENPEMVEKMQKRQEFSNADRARTDEKAKVKKDFMPTYREIERLILNGNIGEATNLVNALSDEDYQLYKEIKATEKRKATEAMKAEVYATYEHVQSLLAQGNTAEAQEIVNGLTDAEYKAYLSLKKLFADEGF